ncbi:MAG TPA: ZIP zinc transporter, partial [Ruminococcaceae bacterium]|nr:ZIP zinc transporter [Oscillospiraceae bacterium]
LTWLVAPILPFVLSFAAGAMIYVVSQELIPEAKSRIGTAGTAVGFALMMM